ncbi:MAG: TetR/AcrR family transcriptional regulator [Bacteroidota bacterium]
MATTNRAHAPGRPRSEQARRAVLSATRALFEEGGYAATTIEAIAARSGVAKTTIYRWWPNRPALVVDLLLQVAATAAPPPTTGSDPVRALRTELHRVARAGEALPGRLLLSLLSEAQQDAEVRNALSKGLFNPRRRATAQVIRQAQASGALRKDVSPLIAVDMLFGPLFYRMLLRQERVSEEYVRQVFENAMAGLRRRRM